MKGRRRALKAAHACNREAGRTAKRKPDGASLETVKSVSFFLYNFLLNDPCFCIGRFKDIDLGVTYNAVRALCSLSVDTASAPTGIICAGIHGRY